MQTTLLNWRITLHVCEMLGELGTDLEAGFLRCYVALLGDWRFWHVEGCDPLDVSGFYLVFWTLVDLEVFSELEFQFLV